MTASRPTTSVGAPSRSRASRRAAVFALGLIAALGALAACSSSTEGGGAGIDAGGDDAATNDATSGDDGGSGDAAGDDAGSGDFTACTGDCTSTTLAAKFKGATFPFDRAAFGVTASDAGPPTIYVEAYSGGAPGCPGPSSPTTDRTFILAGLPVPTDATPATNGVKGSLFDFKGDMLDTPLAKATSVTATARAAAPLTGSTRFVSYTIDATFPDGGSVTGGLYAEHCDSLDQ